MKNENNSLIDNAIINAALETLLDMMNAPQVVEKVETPQGYDLIFADGSRLGIVKF